MTSTGKHAIIFHKKLRQFIDNKEKSPWRTHTKFWPFMSVKELLIYFDLIDGCANKKQLHNGAYTSGRNKKIIIRVENNEGERKICFRTVLVIKVALFS